MRYIIRRLFDFIAPRTCAICGCRLAPAEDVLCPVCQMHLPRTGYHEQPLDNSMAKLFFGIVPMERVSAYCFFTSGSGLAQMIYKMKYHDRPDIGESLGHMMGRRLQPSGFFDGVDCLVPIPLAPKRLRQRGYNQSRQLAVGISEVTGLPVADNLLSRSAFAGSQTKLGRWDRQQNVGSVFHLVGDADELRGRHVMLVDDVVTTGATTAACARELLKVEGVKVSLLAFAYSKS